jgi:tetratricopeptide (TPR) repeat protein
LKPKVKKPVAGGDSKDDINNEGVELMSSKAYAQAIEKFETALKMDPNYELAKENLSRAYNNYALDLASKGKEQEAETLMQKAMHLKDSIRNATLKLTTMHNYAQLLRKLRREKEAASLEEEARAIDPKEAKQ